MSYDGVIPVGTMIGGPVQKYVILEYSEKIAVFDRRGWMEINPHFGKQ